MPLLLRLFVFLPLILLVSCGDEANVGDVELVETPEQIDQRAEDLIKGSLNQMVKSDGMLPDSFRVKHPLLIEGLYEKNDYHPYWSSNGIFTSGADSMMTLINRAKTFGLFPQDYYQNKLSALRLSLTADTSDGKLDAASWAYHDLVMSAAFVRLVRDLKAGRLLADSLVSRDSSLALHFYQAQMDSLQTKSTESFVAALEPGHMDYKNLRAALPGFLDSADFRQFTRLDLKDSLHFKSRLYKRLREEDSSLIAMNNPDSLSLANAVKKYQKKKGLEVDGKAGNMVVRSLNDTDWEKFIRIAISLDRYKQLPAFPDQYLWVNIPSFSLQLRKSDTVKLTSRVVVGKPITRTPLITSAISDMITYPKWHIPESIIKKEILPGLKKNPGYTRKRGYMIVDKNGEEIDPYSVDWSKYKTGIPYRVIQGSGDDNALGILKFNFPNQHSVYLHDTNQRYLFSRSARALSHGCVRVQAWSELAEYILRNDSLHSSNAIPVDSLRGWLKARQIKYIPVRKPLPLFIRYVTCEARDGKMIFHEDIYEEDRKLRQRIFSDK